MRDRHHVEAAFAQISDEPGKDGEPSGIDRILQGWEDEKAGRARKLGSKEEKRAYAFRVYARGYLGDPDAKEERSWPQVAPFPGMSAEEARQIVEWVKAGDVPDDVWATELLPHWPAICAAAEQG